jgi:2-keto-4-pentenoate hydratase
MSPLDAAAARDAADVLWTLWSERRTVAALPERCRPRSLEDGWLVQRALDERAGPGAGWKIAATSAAGQRHIGADGPLAGRLYRRSIVSHGAELPAGHLTMGTAEAEFAFRFGRDVEADGGDVLDRASVLAAVDALIPAIEVPDSRFADFLAVGLPSLLADAMCLEFVVVGEPATAWDPEELPTHPVRMLRNGDEVAAGTGANVLGDPCEALVWLARELARHGEALRAGDLVITGASTPPNPIAPGDELLADFGALGTVGVHFT